jgi:PAS domain S-box-containing protein
MTFARDAQAAPAGDAAKVTNATSPASAARSHAVQFYADEQFLTERVAAFLAEALLAGEVAVVLATQPHMDAYRRRLETEGVNVLEAVDSGRLTFVEARALLSRFMRDGQPEPGLFEQVLGALLDQASQSAPGAKLHAYGEMVDLLWQDGARDAAIHLEELWNALQSRRPLSLLCAYALGNFYKEPAQLQRVCATHTHVMPATDALSDEQTNPYATVPPPQYAERLALELAKRAEVEQALRESLRELRAQKEAAHRNEEQLRDFVENATIGLHRVGPDGTILWANRAELDMLGYTEEEYIGRPIAAFHADRPIIEDILCKLKQGEVLHDYEARLRAKDGSIKHVLISSSVYAPDGEFVHTRCFTRDITARRQAEEALRSKQAQLQAMTDALPAAVFHVDAEFRYLFVNATFERWFRRSKAEILGKRAPELLHEDEFGHVREQLERALAGEPVSYETQITYPDGSTRHVCASYVPQRAAEGGATSVIALVTDITESKRLEAFRAASLRRAERLARITAAVAEAVTSEEVLVALVDRVYEAVEATSVALWLTDDGGTVARLARALGYSVSVRGELEALSLDTAPGMPALDALRTREPIWIDSRSALLEQYPHLSAMVSAGDAYAVACLPLVSRGRALGVIGLTIAGRELDEDERSFLLLSARYATQALERLRLLEAERRSRAAADEATARMSVLSGASQIFVETDLSLDLRLDAIVAALGGTLGSSVSIALAHPDGSFRTSAVYHPVPEAQEALRELALTSPTRAGEGMIGAVASTGESLFAPSLGEDLLKRVVPAYREFLSRYPAFALMCVPLRARGETVGLVTTTRVHPNETYTSADLELLEELADRAAVTIENSRLYQDARDARSRAEQLSRFAQAVVAAEEVESVFDAALSAIEAGLGAKRSAILTLDANGVMRFARWRNLSDAYRRAVEGHSPWPRDAEAPEPVLVADAAQDPSFASYRQLFQSEQIGALAFIPLVTRRRLIGKFMVYYERPHHFTRSEIETAAAIASHLASVTVRFAAVAKVEESLRANELFTGVLAHDLLNPLSAIMNGAQMLLMRREGEAAATDREAKPLARILSSAQRMNRMIEQLLDFTRARVGGGLEIRTRSSDLGEVAAQAVGEIELANPDCKLELTSRGDLSGTWDPDRLLQVASNLLANAAHHGRPGEVVSLTLDGTEPEHVRMFVHNQGAVSAALLPHLFDPFRTSRQGRAQSRGLGLGLFIVRELVQAHGGTVDVASSDADGTTFSILLPRVAMRRQIAN